MQQFIGTWHGTGKAFFPTIDDTDYREVLVVVQTSANCDPHGAWIEWLVL